MRKLTALGTVGLVVGMSGVGCGSSEDDSTNGANTGAFDSGGLDIQIDSHLDQALDLAVEAAPDGGTDAAPEATPEAAADAAPEAAIDATPEATVDAPPEAEACSPIVATCELLAGMQPIITSDAGTDAGTDAAEPDAGTAPAGPAITVDPQGGTVGIAFDPNGPTFGGIAVTLQWIDATSYLCNGTIDVTLTSTDGHLFTADLPDLPSAFIDFCGATLHVTDACTNAVTDLPINIAGSFGDYEIACAQICGADQWKAAITQACDVCPAPDAQCSDLDPDNGNATLTFESSTRLFTLTLAAGAPEFESGTLTLLYTQASTYKCTGTVTIPVTAQGNTLVGTMPPQLPNDFYSEPGFCAGGTLTLVEKCGNTVSFGVAGSGSSQNVQWYFQDQNCGVP